MRPLLFTLSQNVHSETASALFRVSTVGAVGCRRMQAPGRSGVFPFLLFRCANRCFRRDDGGFSRLTLAACFNSLQPSTLSADGDRRVSNGKGISAFSLRKQSDSSDDFYIV
jgi:hypothetical protein